MNYDVRVEIRRLFPDEDPGRLASISDMLGPIIKYPGHIKGTRANPGSFIEFNSNEWSGKVTVDDLSLTAEGKNKTAKYEKRKFVMKVLSEGSENVQDGYYEIRLDGTTGASYVCFYDKESVDYFVKVNGNEEIDSIKLEKLGILPDEKATLSFPDSELFKKIGYLFANFEKALEQVGNKAEGKKR